MVDPRLLGVRPRARKLTPDRATEDEFTAEQFLETVARAGWTGARFNPSRTAVNEARRAGLVYEHHDHPGLFPLFIPTERLVRRFSDV